MNLILKSIATFILTSFIASSVTFAEKEAFKSGEFDPPRMAPDFTLTGSNGSKVTLSQFRGKVVILKFGFTYCKTVCPVTLSHLSQVFKELGDQAKEVQVLFVTVDPERDTPKRMKEYLKAFHPSFIGATGPDKKLDKINDDYGIFVTKAKENNPDYEIHHSSSIYLIDRAGKLRTLMPFGKTADDILHDVRILLK